MRPTRKSFRVVRACVRAVWLPSEIRVKISGRALSLFPFTPDRLSLFPFLPPLPTTSYPALLALSVLIKYSCIWIGAWGGETNREIVSWRACVRARGLDALSNPGEKVICCLSLFPFWPAWLSLFPSLPPLPTTSYPALLALSVNIYIYICMCNDLA